MSQLYKLPEGKTELRVIILGFAEVSAAKVMKAFVICCALVGVIQVRGAPLSGEQKQKLEKYHKDCLRESSVDEILVEKSRKGFISDDPGFKNYLFCFSQRVGLQDVEGTIQKDVFHNKIKFLVDDEALLTKLDEECAIQKDSPQETSFYIARCLRELAPSIELFKVAPEVVYLPSEKAEKFLLIHKECAAQDSLGEEVIEQARKRGALFGEPKFKNYIYCFLKQQGIQRGDGTVDKEAFLKSLNKIIDDSIVVDKLVKKCNQEQDTPENTAFFVSKCVHENSPVYVELFPREITVPDDIAKKIIANGRACIKETGVDKAIIEKSRQGIYTDDPTFKEFTFCVAKKAGFLNEVGDIQVDVLREKTLRLFNNPAIVQKLIDQCAVRKETPQETAFFAHVCFHKNSPGHLSIIQFGAVSAEQREKRKQIIKECAEETGIPRGIVLSARNGDFQDDPLLKQYFLCINKKSDILNDAGEYNLDVMKKGLTEIFNAQEADRLIAKCARDLDGPLNTSFEGTKCFFHEIPEATIIF